jgi:protein-glutamine gamma-glutamyltransferase
MIEIGGKAIDTIPAREGFEANALMQTIFDTMRESDETYSYDTPDQLIFELKLRNAVVAAARELSRSGIKFAVFRDSTANADFWTRTDEGGFELKSGVKPSDAIRDIYEHGSQYATECATAMVIVYYKAMLDVFPEDLFNKTYADIYLMNWEKLDRDLDVVEADKPADELPGDAKYFMNPDVDPLHPEGRGAVLRAWHRHCGRRQDRPRTERA